jgi:hypothetical protein
MEAQNLISLLKLSIQVLFVICIISCKKITHRKVDINVIVMNDITQQPEPGEEVILVERKEKFTGLMGIPYEDKILSKGITNSNGVVNFGEWELKKREKFSYLVKLQYKSNYSNYQHVIDEVEIDTKILNNFIQLAFGPTITGLYVKPKSVIDYNSGSTYFFKAQSEYRIRKGIATSNDSIFFSPYLPSQFELLKINASSMGTYFITLVKHKNGIQDTIFDTIFCPRDQDYIYEFEF